MKPYNIYVKDFIVRCLYFLFSYTLCLFIFFYKMEDLFLLEVHPLVKLTNKRFIVTTLTDFIDVVWFLSVYMSNFFLYPLFFYHSISFFCNSWYNYQLKFYKKLLGISFLVFFICFFIIHYTFLPLLFNFFLYWEIKEDSSLLRIETETTLVSYVTWTLNFKSIFCSFLIFFILSSIIFFNFATNKRIYNFVKYNKNTLTFSFILLLFLLTPPDFSMQLLIVISSFFINDILFFFACTKFYKSNYILKNN